ncbi:hypothetical protein ACJ2A9_03060 [Anaerobacillus sp. MEB173]|uniref:hypothetical protein n=1 Tax=Anaerobacillus sp. MEB173 TaxID=3383345 RepID=UPI003F8E8E8D
MSKFGYMVIGAVFTIILSVGYLTFAANLPDGLQIEAGEPIAVNDNNQLSQNDHKVSLADEIIVGEAVALTTPQSLVKDDVQVVAENDQNNRNDESNQLTHSNSNDLLSNQPTDNINNIKPGNYLQQVDKLEIEIENDDIEIEIKQERKKKKVKSEVKIKTNKKEMKLKDEKAEQFINEMYSAVSIESAKDIQAAVENLLSQYNVDISQVEIEIKVEASGSDYQFKNKGQNDDDDDDNDDDNDD